MDPHNQKKKCPPSTVKPLNNEHIRIHIPFCPLFRGCPYLAGSGRSVRMRNCVFKVWLMGVVNVSYVDTTQCRGALDRKL